MNMSELSNRLFTAIPLGRPASGPNAASRMERLISRFLRSRWSRPLIGWYAWRHRVHIDRKQLHGYKTFRDFFARDCAAVCIDPTPEHLISPCDGWLLACPIDADGSFSVKGERYGVRDLFNDPQLTELYNGGLCLVFRFDPSDCHRFCYVDDAYLWENHYIPEKTRDNRGNRPFHMNNRRSWCLMATRSFGPVVQVEIGAHALGGIVNNRESGRVWRGDEKGHFELAGSSIVLLFEPGQIQPISYIHRASETGREVRVRRGMWIGIKRD